MGILNVQVDPGTRVLSKLATATDIVNLSSKHLSLASLVSGPSSSSRFAPFYISPTFCAYNTAFGLLSEARYWHCYSERRVLCTSDLTWKNLCWTIYHPSTQETVILWTGSFKSDSLLIKKIQRQKCICQDKIFAGQRYHNSSDNNDQNIFLSVFCTLSVNPSLPHSV